MGKDMSMEAARWSYTMAQIADAAGLDPQLVRRHRRDGRFDPDSLVSVSMYIVAAGLDRINRMREADGPEERRDD